jgi:hypothetical protein
MKVTKENLILTPEFKEWVKGKVILIHDPYQDGVGTFIVISMNMGKVSITRFWTSPNRLDQLDKIRVSLDYTDISVEETFSILLNEYSLPLK